MVKLGKRILFANIFAISAFAFPNIGNCANVPIDIGLKPKKIDDAKKTQKKAKINDVKASDEAAANIEPKLSNTKATKAIVKNIVIKKAIDASMIKTKEKSLDNKNEDIKADNKINSKPVILKENLPKTEIISQEQMMVELGMFGAGKEVTKTKKTTKIDGAAPWQKIGSPYQVNGIWYIPAFEGEYDEIGIASWYGDDFNGKPTANGEIFDMDEVSIAHPTLPIPSLVEVINLENGRSIIARVNDRGPFVDGRIIDVSKKAAQLLGFKDKGKAKVRVKYIGYANPAKEKQNTIFALDKLNPKIDNEKVQFAKLEDKQQKVVNQTKLTQIGSFINMQYAEKFVQNQSGNKNLKIVEAQTNIGKFYRVFEVSTPSKPSENKYKQPETKNNIDHNSILASL